MLGLQCRIVREVKPCSLNDKETVSSTTDSNETNVLSISKGSVQMASWLLRSADDRSVQLVTKVCVFWVLSQSTA